MGPAQCDHLVFQDTRAQSKHSEAVSDPRLGLGPRSIRTNRLVCAQGGGEEGAEPPYCSLWPKLFHPIPSEFLSLREPGELKRGYSGPQLKRGHGEGCCVGAAPHSNFGASRSCSLETPSLPTWTWKGKCAPSGATGKGSGGGGMAVQPSPASASLSQALPCPALPGGAPSPSVPDNLPTKAVWGYRCFTVCNEPTSLPVQNSGQEVALASQGVPKILLRKPQVPCVNNRVAMCPIQMQAWM